MSNKTYFSRINDGQEYRYVKDAEVREFIEDTYGYKTFEDNEFTYRNSGGDNDIETGIASIERIKGNTVAWNQLSTNGASEYRYDRDSARIRTLTFSKIPSGRKILLFYLIKDAVESTSGTNTFGIEYGTNKQIYNPIKNGISANIVTLQEERNNVYTFINIGCSSGTAFTMQDFMTFDLTIIYGAGNEPTTPEQFEADYERWFGKPLTYEEYDAGSIKPVLMQSVKTTGFNQWDEQWEIGNINVLTGENTTNSNTIRSKNYIPVSGNLPYYCYCGNGNNLIVFFYDSNKNFINYRSYDSFSNKVSNFPTNTAYIRVASKQDYGSTYNNNICINLSDHAKNGTYEPYEEHLASVPVTSAKGRLLDANGSPVGNSVFVFPDGLKKVGNVQDEIFVENGVVKAIKRVGSVDISTLEWTYDNNTRFKVDFRLVKTSSEWNKTSLLCNKYVVGIVFKDGSAGDKTIGVDSHNIFVKDTSYDNATSFKAAMQGVMLYYELATPETYVLNDNPLIDYYVNKYGTEEIISSSNGIAPILDINYPVKSSDSLHTLVKDHISSKDMNTFLKEFKDTTGIILNKVWNSNTNSYEFKYNTSPEGDAFVKNKPIIAKDDAAQAYWGGAWRMPTEAEFQAFSNAVNTAWTADYQGSGVAGLICTDKTDSSKTLFFSAVGGCSNGSISGVGSYGVYWSSSLRTSDVVYGRYLGFNNDSCFVSNFYRYFGCAVRGVLDGPNVNANGHDYVEIGGVKWATMNIGANSITDTGLYFQWGDTQGYTASQVGSGEGQKYFGWADYKYGNGTSSPGAAGMIKYNSTDGLTVLETSEPISCLHEVAVSGVSIDILYSDLITLRNQ